MTADDARKVVAAAVARIEFERDELEAALRNIMEVCPNDSVAIKLANEAIEKFGRNE